MGNNRIGRVATIYLKGGGEPREIHYDVIQCVPHGFNFARADGTMTFLAASQVEEFVSVKSTPIAGSA